MTLTQREIHTSFADLSIIPLYRNRWRSLVVLYLQLWLALVIVFELTMDILILRKGPTVKVGLVGAILFFLFLVPFWWQGGALLNIVFAVILALLLRYDNDANLIDLVRLKGSRERVLPRRTMGERHDPVVASFVGWGPLPGGWELWPSGPSPQSLDAEGKIYVATKDRTTLYVLAPLG